MAKVIELIKESMKEKKMTQTELAKSLGEDVRVINQQLNRQQDLKGQAGQMPCRGNLNRRD